MRMRAESSRLMVGDWALNWGSTGRMRAFLRVFCELAVLERVRLRLLPQWVLCVWF